MVRDNVRMAHQGQCQVELQGTQNWVYNGLRIGLDKAFKCLHDYRAQDDWSAVIQSSNVLETGIMVEVLKRGNNRNRKKEPNQFPNSQTWDNIRKDNKNRNQCLVNTVLPVLQLT